MIYGHGQQRRAVIEAVRLLKDGKKILNRDPDMVDEVSGVSSPQHFKDKSKKWLKYVTKVSSGLFCFNSTLNRTCVCHVSFAAMI